MLCALLVALLGSLSLGAGSAAAATPRPTIAFEGVEAGYTSAHVKFTLGPSQYTYLYDLQYTTNLTSEVEEGEWRDGGGGDIGGGEQTWPYEKPLEPGGSHAVNEIIPRINPGTKYQYRVVIIVYDENEYPFFRYPEAPEPQEFLETKSVAKPVVAFNSISEVTLDSAQFAGTVNTSYPGGLDAEGEAAYKTEWKYVCQPECPDLPTTTVQAGEPTQPASLEAIRLEANTYYEVSLEATNAAGTTSVTKSFQTPLVAPTVKPLAGGSAGAGSFNVGGIVQPFNTKISSCHFEYGPTTEYVYSAPCSPDPVGRTEIQKILVGGNAGQFKLRFRGQTTEDIQVGAPASVVEHELKALSVIGPAGIVEVTGGECFFCFEYEVFFGGPLASTNLAPIIGLNGTEEPHVETGNPMGPPTISTIVNGGNNAPVLVEAHLTGLTPGATYHYDLFATNSVGTVSTGDQTFIPPLASEEAECPNQVARAENNSTSLPECRAYELVTSAPKSGFPASLTTASENEAVAYLTKAGNIENSGQGSAFFNYYVANRTDQGWKTAPNLSGPKGSIFYPRGKVQTINFGQFSPDLSESIWTMVVEGKPEGPYLRGPKGEFTEVGDGPPNGGGLPFSLYIGASTDLHHVYYYGMGYTFFPPAWGPEIGPGLYEFEGTGNVGPPRRIDLLDSGEPISNCFAGNFVEGASTFDSASDDGSTVFFTEKGCEGHPAQVWARVDASKSYFASQSQCTRTAGDPGGACYEPWDGTYTGGATFQSGATDGSRVVFTTQQQLLNEDTNEDNDIYEYVLPTESDPNPSPNLIDVTASSPDAKVQQVLRASDDCKTIYFIARGVLAANRDALDEPARAGDENLYVWHQDTSHPEGETKFIGRLTAQPDFSELFGEAEWPYVKHESEVTSDGRYFAFKALTPLTPNDTDNAADLFRYDDSTGELIRVSVDAAGTGGNGDDQNIGFTAAKEHTHPGMTDDGQEIVFTTSEALSANDGNGAPDIYIWKEGHTALISTGSVGGGAQAAVMDGSGNNIYFSSTQKLTPEDTDSVSDVYDARIDGGFSFAHVENCSGEACQPEPQPEQAAPVPATYGANGSGNYQRATVSIDPLAAAQKKKLASGGRATINVRVSGAGSVSLEGSASVHKKPIQAFAASRRSVQPGPLGVPVKLGKGALAQLRKTGKLTIQVSAEFADAEPAGSAVTLKAPGGRAKHGRKHGH